MGNPFVHIDLTTGDIGAAKKFYKSVFDWKLKDYPKMGGWVGIDVGQGVGGGISGKQMPEQPIAWTSYVGVASVKKTIAKAKKAGATVYVEYQEIPGMGALGVFADPQGAVLGVWETAARPAPAAKKAAAKKPAAKKPAAKKAAPKKAAAKKPAAKKAAPKKK